MGAVRHDAHREPLPGFCHRLDFLENKGLQHFLYILGQSIIEKTRGYVGDGPPNVAFNQLNDTGRLGGEAPHVQITVKKEGRDVRAVEEVFHIIVS